LITKKSFPNTTKVIDWFHVPKLALETLKEISIKYRWLAIDQENETTEKAKQNKSKWPENQTERTTILSESYPDIQKKKVHLNT
jgi:transposase